MKYTIVTRTVTLREQTVDLDFGPLVSEKQADSLVRGGAKNRKLIDPEQFSEGKVIYEGSTVSSIVRAGKMVWGSKPVAAKIEDAEKKAVPGDPPKALAVTSDEHPKANL